MNVQTQPQLAGSEIALQFYQAVLTRDYTTLRDTFHWSKEELESFTVEQQFTSAGKLISSGNMTLRKVPITKAAIEAHKQTAADSDKKTEQPATVTRIPTFCPNPSGKKIG